MNVSKPGSNRQYNVVVLGEGGSGKSSLVLSLTGQQLRTGYDPTIEDSYRVENNGVMWDLLDTPAGQEEFASLREQFLRAGKVFIIAFDVTDSEWEIKIEKHKTDLEMVLGGVVGTSIAVVLVGTKGDLEHKIVTEEMGRVKARSWNCEYIETSAKEQRNSTEVLELLQKAVEKIQAESESPRASCCLVL